MEFGYGRHNDSSLGFKSITVGTGSGGSRADLKDTDLHSDENMMQIPRYTIASLPTVGRANLSTFGAEYAIGSATLLLFNPDDGTWYRWNGTAI